MQNFITIFFTVLQIGLFSLFQNLDLRKASNDKTQKFIKIFHSVQEIGAFSLFQNLALGKASTDDKCHFAIPCARSCQYQCVCKILSIFSFFQNLNLGKISTNLKCHLTISWATSYQYTNVYAKFHRNIPLSSRDRAIFTFSEFGARQNLDR